MKKDLLKNNKGISMIALIITILVMLILAVVVFAIASGEEGVISNAEKAKKAQILARIEESIDLSSTKLTEDSIISEINKGVKEQIATLSETELSILNWVSEPFGVTISKDMALGKMDTIEIEDSLNELLYDLVNKGTVKIEGYFLIPPADVIGPNDDYTIEIEQEKYDEFDSLSKDSEKYVFLKKLSKEYLDDSEQKGKVVLLKTLYMDKYLIKITYEDIVWYISSVGEVNDEEIPDVSAYEFITDTTKVIGYTGKKSEITIPEKKYFTYITEIGKYDSSVYSDDRTDDYMYQEKYWSIIMDKGIKMTGSELTNMATEGAQTIPFNESNFEAYQQLFTMIGMTVTSYEEAVKKTYAKEFTTADGVKDAYFYIKLDGTPKFYDVQQTVEKVTVPSTIKKIYPYALAGDSMLKHVYLPAELFYRDGANVYDRDTIGYKAFEASHSSLIIHIKTPEGWTDTDKSTAESTIRGLSDAKAEGYTISWE